MGAAVFLLGDLLFGQLAFFCGSLLPGASCPRISLGLRYPPAAPSAAAAFVTRVPVVPPVMLLVGVAAAVIGVGSYRMWTRGLAGRPVAARALVLAATWGAALAAGEAAGSRASGFLMARDILGSPPFQSGMAAATAGRLDFLTFAAVVVLVAGFAGTLVVEPGRTEWDAEALAERLRSQEVLLFLGAALLVLSVAARAALFRWGLSLAAKDDAAKLAQQIVDSIVASGGAAYTLVLVGVYGPALLVLRDRATRLALARSGEATSAGRRKWMEERDLSFPITKRVANLVAALGPFLAAGPLSAFTKLLGG
jgi:hypothetical protein